MTVAGVGTGNIERMERIFYRAFTRADDPQLAVLRRAPRHTAGGVRPLRRGQQRARTGRARLDRRGGELMCRSRPPRRPTSNVGRDPWSGADRWRHVPAAAQERFRISANVGQQATTTTVTQEQTFDRYFEQGSFTFEPHGSEGDDLRFRDRGPGVEGAARGGGRVAVREDRPRHGDGEACRIRCSSTDRARRQATLRTSGGARSGSISWSAGTFLPCPQLAAAQRLEVLTSRSSPVPRSSSRINCSSRA